MLRRTASILLPLTLAALAGCPVQDPDSLPFERVDANVHDTIGSLVVVTWEQLVDGRDVSEAPGLVSVAVLDCPWVDAEAITLRPDQDVVLDDIYETHERTYLTSRPACEQAAEQGEYVTIEEPLDVFGDGFRGGKTDPSLTRAHDRVSTSRFGVTLHYDLEGDFRHGIYEVHGAPTEVALAGGYLPEAASGADGVNTFEQAYSIDVKVPHGADRTLRLYAVWAYLDSPWISPDDPLCIATTVNESRDAAQRMSDVCSGAVALPPEDGVGGGS